MTGNPLEIKPELEKLLKVCRALDDSQLNMIANNISSMSDNGQSFKDIAACRKLLQFYVPTMRNMY